MGLFLLLPWNDLFDDCKPLLISVNVDHNASDNFYQTEGILEEVKTGLLEYAGDAGEEAYKDVVEHYTKTKDSMHKTFSEKYISLRHQN